MATPLVSVDAATLRDLRQWLGFLSDAELNFKPYLSRVHRDLAKEVAADAQGAARALGGVHRKAAPAISGRGTMAGAKIGLGRAKSIPFAGAALWGAKQTTGWNAGGTSPNLPPWVGTGWDVGGPGGPYAINETIRRQTDDIVRRYGDGLDDLARRVGFR